MPEGHRRHVWLWLLQHALSPAKVAPQTSSAHVSLHEYLVSMRVRPAVPLRWVSQSVARLHLVFVPEESMSPCTTPSHSLVQVSPAPLSCKDIPSSPCATTWFCATSSACLMRLCATLSPHTALKPPVGIHLPPVNDFWCAAHLVRDPSQPHSISSRRHFA